MRYNIVAGEELKKIMLGILDDPMPFNEDMSVGDFHCEPFSEEFIKERSMVHNVVPSIYKEKLHQFLELLKVINHDDEIHLYFGEDKTCLANRELLINYFIGKVKNMTLHIVNEYTGEEIEERKVL